MKSYFRLYYCLSEEGFETETTEIVLHNTGMRSGIECSLCARCPRDRVQGCCSISPVFLLTDIGYFLNNSGSDFISNLMNRPYVDVLEDRFRVNAIVKVGDRSTCRFHHPEIGCRIPLVFRNTVCRQFLCPDVKLWQDLRARRWVNFWLQLQEEEIKCQQFLAAECTKRGYSLNDSRFDCLQFIKERYQVLRPEAGLPAGYPQAEIILLDKQHQGLIAAK